MNGVSQTCFLNNFFLELPIDASEKTNASGIFVNNEICLSDIRVYGFDYDYTLAQYKDELHHVLYDLAKESLIKKYKVSVFSLNLIFTYYSV